MPEATPVEEEIPDAIPFPITLADIDDTVLFPNFLRPDANTADILFLPEVIFGIFIGTALLTTPPIVKSINVLAAISPADLFVPPVTFSNTWSISVDEPAPTAPPTTGPA